MSAIRYEGVRISSNTGDDSPEVKHIEDQIVSGNEGENNEIISDVVLSEIPSIEENLSPTSCQKIMMQSQAPKRSTILANMIRSSFRNIIEIELDKRPEFITKGLEDRGFFSVYSDIMKKNPFFLIKNTLLIHFISILITIGVIYINKYYAPTCFYPKICNCSELDIFKLIFGLARDIIYNTPLFLGSYHCVFSMNEIPRSKFLKLLHIFLNVCTLIITTVISPKNLEFPFLYKNIMGALIIILFYLYYLKKFKFGIAKLWRVSKLNIFITVFLFSHHNIVGYVLPVSKSIIYTNRSKAEGDLYYSFVVILMTFIVKAFYDLILNKYDQYLKDDKVSYNSTIYYSRVALSMLFGLRIANIIDLDYQGPGFYVAVFSLILFIVNLHTGFSFVFFSLKVIYFRVIHKKWLAWKPSFEKSRKIMSSQHFDFLIIYISRIVILYHTRIAIHMHYTENYVSCNLEFKPHFLEVNLANFLVFLATDVLTTILVFHYCRKRNWNLNKYFIDHDINFFVRIIFIVSFHLNLEYTMSMYGVSNS